jgi:hypothetical protein
VRACHTAWQMFVEEVPRREMLMAVVAALWSAGSEIGARRGHDLPLCTCCCRCIRCRSLLWCYSPWFGAECLGCWNM